MAISGYSHLQSCVLMFMILIILISSVCPLSFSFSKFDANNQDIEYEGNAFPFNGTIKLTTTLNNSFVYWSSSRVTYKKRVQLGNKSTGTLIDFDTKFSFFITTKESTGDGLVFFLAANRSLPINSCGQCLGLMNCQNLNSSQSPFVAVEFDNYKNSWDPDYYHVGIDVNSLESVVTRPWLPESRRVNAHVRYDSDSETLTAIVTYDDVPNSIYDISHVVDLRESLLEWVIVGFSASSGVSLQMHTITSWDFNSTLATVDANTNATEPVGSPTNIGNRQGSKGKNVLKIAISLSVFVLILAPCLIWFLCKKNQRLGSVQEIVVSSNPFDVVNDGGVSNDTFGRNTYKPKRFSFGELAEATGNFKRERIIGRGGFGLVYSGILREEGIDVAIKRFNEDAGQGIKEFKAEVNIISRIRHRNLVELFGYYHDEGQNDLILVYEFMHNGSLHDHLFNERSCMLTWEKRYGIAVDLAHGLHYLHEGGKQYVVHRDIKSANVLLGLNFKAKLGDFGLARLVEQGNDPLTTYKAGTRGYLAPECALYDQKPSKESDVYSFGIVALEICCGKKPLEQIGGKTKELVHWVWKLYGKGKILEAADARLCEEFDKEEMVRLLHIGLWCAHPHKRSRPSIEVALYVLLFKEAKLPALPPEKPEWANPSLTTVSESSSSSLLAPSSNSQYVIAQSTLVQVERGVD